MFCNQCGSQLSEDAEFCYQCGAKVQGMDVGKEADKKICRDDIKPYYREEFERIASGQKPKFNWAAFFLNGWNQTYNGCTGIFCKTFLPVLIALFGSSLIGLLGTAKFDLVLISVSLIMGTLVGIYSFILCIINGFQFNKWYYQDVIKNPAKKRSRKPFWILLLSVAAAYAILYLVEFKVIYSDIGEIPPDLSDNETDFEDAEDIYEPMFDTGINSDTNIEDSYYIGDTVSMLQTGSSGETGSYDITMTDWGTYYESVGEDIYVYAAFEVVNTGNEDIFISDYSFDAYVNDYKVDIGCWLADDNLSATLSPGRRTNGKVYIKMNPEDVSQLELELGDMMFRIQDNSFPDEAPFGYEGEDDYTDYIEWGGIYDDGWQDTELTFSLYSDGAQDPECGSLTTNFRGMSDTGKLYYLGGNAFRWESEGYDSTRGETYYVYAVYHDQEYQLELYNSNNEYEVTFTLYEQYIP